MQQLSSPNHQEIKHELKVVGMMMDQEKTTLPAPSLANPSNKNELLYLGEEPTLKLHSLESSWSWLSHKNNLAL